MPQGPPPVRFVWIGVRCRVRPWRHPALEDALTEFFEWVNDRPMIAHNGFGYDFIVLEAERPQQAG